MSARTEIQRLLAQLQPDNVKAAKIYVRMEECSHEMFLAVHGLQETVTVGELKEALGEYSSDGLFVGGSQTQKDEEESIKLKKISRDDPDYDKYEFVEGAESDEESDEPMEIDTDLENCTEIRKNTEKDDKDYNKKMAEEKNRTLIDSFPLN